MKLAKFRKMAAYALSLTMLMSFTPSVAFGETAAAEGTKTFIDMPTNWATAGLEHAVANGLLKGYETADGLQIRPSGNITRAELVTVVNRAFGASEKAALTGVTDVKNGAWYADEIAKAICMQTMSKAEKVRPNDSITRQEAFTILARAYRQSGGTRNSFAKFTDSTSVADFAVDGVGALVEKGYVNGADGKLNPTGYLTRAEFAKIMDNLTAAYVNTTAAYSQNVTGNVIVNTPGAKLKDMKINGNLIIADGVGEGDVDVENVAITGDIIVKAGGENSIHIANVTVGGTLVVNKVGGTVRIVASGTTNVKMVEVGSDVIITATDLKGGEIGTVKIDGSDVSDVVLRGDFKTVETAVKDVKITANEGKIGEFVMTEKATVTGASTITTVKNETNEAVSVNGKTVEAGKSTSSGTTDTPAATGGSTGGGSGAPGGGGTGGGSGSGGGSGTGGGSTQPTTKYTITVSDTTNGTVTAAKTSNIEAGESVVITITPDTNYQLNTITVNGVDKTSSVADGKLTVTVNENLTVAATFESTSTGGGGGQTGRVNPAPDPEANGGAVAFAEGYPVIDLENHKVKIKMAAATASEVFGIVVAGNNAYNNPSSIDVIHGHPNDLAQPDETLYFKVSDTEEHALDFSVFSGNDGQALYAALVVKTGDNISATPIKAEASAQAVQESDTVKPTLGGASVTSDKTKIIIQVSEHVNITETTKDEFNITGASITGARVDSVDAGNTVWNRTVHYIELSIENCDTEPIKLAYNGESITDDAGNKMDKSTWETRVRWSSQPQIANATYTQNRKVIQVETDNSMLNAGGLLTGEKFELRYGSSWESGQTCGNKVVLHDARFSTETNSTHDIFNIVIENPPAEEENYKYFIKISTQGMKTAAMEIVSEDLSAQAEVLSATINEPSPVATINTEPRLTVTFADNSILKMPVGDVACRLFIKDNAGNIYKLRGWGWNDNGRIDFFEGENHRGLFPFDTASFNWSEAKLCYSNLIHPDAGLYEDIIKADGNILEEFEVPITVEP